VGMFHEGWEDGEGTRDQVPYPSTELPSHEIPYDDRCRAQDDRDQS